MNANKKFTPRLCHALLAPVLCASLLFLLTSAIAQLAGPPSRRKATPTKHAEPRPQSPQAAAEAPTDEPGPPVDGIRTNNLGVALMDQGSYSEAFANFQTACIMVPDSNTGCLNSAIALIAMEQYDAARKILTTDVSREAENPRAWFTLGLLNRIQGQNDGALVDFEKTAELDPNDASTECLIGQIYVREGKHDAAVAAFNRALKIDPLSAAAESGLADALGKIGDTAARQTHQERYEYLRGLALDLSLSGSLGDKYGEQGPYSLAAEVPSPTVVGAASPIRFVNVTQQSGLPLSLRAAQLAKRSGRGRGGTLTQDATNSGRPEIQSMADFLGSGACVFDYDGDGLPDIFLADADGEGRAALYRNLGHGRFADATKKSKIDVTGGMGCTVGDYDNDGNPDLAVSVRGGVSLWHNEGNGAFTNATAASGIHADGLVMGVSFVDYDRDGNLDLYVTRFHDFPLPHPNQPFEWLEDALPGNMLWHNAGNGTFVDVTNELGVAGSASATGAIVSDFTNSGALDLLLTGPQPTPSLLVNPREGAFQKAEPWGAESQGPTAGGVALDFDKDGRMDVALTHWQPTTLGLWRNVDGKTFERVALPDPGWMRAWGIAALDYDRDGWIDLVAVGDTFSGEGRIALLRNEGGKGFHDVTPETGLDKIALHDPRSVIPFDAEGDGSLYLLITQNHRPPMLLKATPGGTHDGENAHNWAKISLKGETENAMAFGVKVEMFSGALRQTWEVSGATGYLSQGPATIMAGLGNQGRADAVRVIWSRAPRQVEIPVPAGRTSVISQQNAHRDP